MDKTLERLFEQARRIRLTPAEGAKAAAMLRQTMADFPVRLEEKSCRTDHMNTNDPALSAARGFTLTRAESERASSQLRAFMETHPIDMPSAVRKREGAATRSASLFGGVRLRFTPALATVIVLLLGMGSVSYAAEFALPGDALYPIKVNVNEKIQGALAVTPQARAALQTALADTRMQEAEALASQHRLTAQTSAALAAAFQTHIADAEQSAHIVAESGNVQEAATLNATIGTELRDRTTSLRALAEHEATDNHDSTVSVLLSHVEQATQSTIAFNDALRNQIAMNAAVQTSSDASQESTISNEASSHLSRASSTTQFIAAKVRAPQKIHVHAESSTSRNTNVEPAFSLSITSHSSQGSGTTQTGGSMKQQWEWTLSGSTASHAQSVLETLRVQQRRSRWFSSSSRSATNSVSIASVSSTSTQSSLQHVSSSTTDETNDDTSASATASTAQSSSTEKEMTLPAPVSLPAPSIPAPSIPSIVPKL